MTHHSHTRTLGGIRLLTLFIRKIGRCKLGAREVALMQIRGSCPLASLAMEGASLKVGALTVGIRKVKALQIQVPAKCGKHQ